MSAHTTLEGKRVLVLGLGETGLSMAQWASRSGAAMIRVADTRAAPPRARELGATVPAAQLRTGTFKRTSFHGIDLIAISPGVPLAEPEVRHAMSAGIEVAGDIELFARALAMQTGAPHQKMLGVAGTNGKSTVTELAGSLCRTAGLDCEVAGNIGPAALTVLSRRLDAGKLPAVWVLELSSYQLETTWSLDLSAAAMLNLSEDHLDRYADMREYAKAKARIFFGHGLQVLNRDDSASMGMRIVGRECVSFGLNTAPSARDFGLIREGRELALARGAEPILPIAEMKLAGLHNAANALAALALVSPLDLPREAIVQALRGFAGLPHRVEHVADIDGIAFYDDSKGTNVGSTVAALDGFAQQLAQRNAKAVLIAGGDGKGQDFAPLAGAVARSARAVVLIGRDAPLIEAALAGSGVRLIRAATLDHAVEQSLALARSGDVVLLSPACASFDMFNNYKHRGESFVRAVREVADARPR